MNTEQKKRAKELALKAAVLLLAGLAYYIFVKLTGWGIPCVFNVITGKLCPGCGITRMFLALAELDLCAAMRYNALVLVLFLPAAVYAVYKAHGYIKNGESEFKVWETVVLMIVLLATVAFGILRNTEAFAFLAP